MLQRTLVDESNINCLGLNRFFYKMSLNTANALQFSRVHIEFFNGLAIRTAKKTIHFIMSREAILELNCNIKQQMFFISTL